MPGSISRKMLNVVTGGFTHVGMRRDHNEDAFVINSELGLYIVADGMGGHNSGEIASKMAIETIENFVKATLADREITWPYKFDPKLNDMENRLRVSTKLANTRIFESSRRNELYHGMGTTLVAVFYNGGSATIANVGDSRVYLHRDGELTQVTVDHSLLNDYLQTHSLTPEEIADFPHKNVIVRALGIKEHVEVDLFRHEPQRGDVLLLCSDGLTDLVPDSTISDIIDTTPEMKMISKLLVREANLKGGNDNITTVLLRFE